VFCLIAPHLTAHDANDYPTETRIQARPTGVLRGVKGLRGIVVAAAAAALLVVPQMAASAVASTPANDMFAAAQVLSGASVSASGTNVGATKETGEPSIAGNGGGASVWYSWTAPGTGVAKIATAGSSFDTLLGVFKGSSVAALSSVAESDDVSGTDKTSVVSFAASAGTTYMIAVDGYHGPTSGQATGSISLSVSQAAPPANDNFVNAQAISAATGSASGTNVGATKESGEPGIAGNSGGASVWYRWTAPSAGSVTIKTAGSSYDTMLGVFTGSSVSALTLVGSNDDVSSTDKTSTVTFTAASGTTYNIMVDGYHGSTSGQATGAVSLSWSLASAPPSGGPANDNFANAQGISGVSGSVNGSNVGATKEAGEPALAGNSGGASIWYRWTAPAAGSVSVNTSGSPFDTMLGIYTGTSVSVLTLVTSNDDVSTSDRTSAVSFNAVAGTTYMITVDGFHGPQSGQATGSVVLNWLQNAPPPPPSGDPMVIAGGDVHANCGSSKDAATAAIINGFPSALALMLGDSTDNGSQAQFTGCYDKTWGAFKSRTRPVPGNHDYDQAGAAPYFSYFGALAGTAGQGYYSYDVGTWHVIALNSNCSKISCSSELSWLQQDLTAHPTQCTLAYWHHPMFTSSPEPSGNDGPVKPFYTALYNAHADVVLVAHSHTYERFAPQDPNGVANANGIREFVVGTSGAAGLETSRTPAANSEIWQASTYGVLALTLHPGSYSWNFLPVAGMTWTDSGSASCR
jgi:hypothetical protein